MDTHIAAQPFAEKVFMFENVAPVPLRLLLGKPDLNDGKDEVAVIGSRFLPDRFELKFIVLDMLDNITTDAFDKTTIR